MHRAQCLEEPPTMAPVAPCPTASLTSTRLPPCTWPVDFPYRVADNEVRGSRRRAHWKSLSRGTPRISLRAMQSLPQNPMSRLSSTSLFSPAAYHQPLGPHAPQSQPPQFHWSLYVSAVSCCSSTMLRVKTSLLYALKAV